MIHKASKMRSPPKIWEIKLLSDYSYAETYWPGTEDFAYHNCCLSHCFFKIDNWTCFLLALIHYKKYGGDPMKRSVNNRIIAQMCQIPQKWPLKSREFCLIHLQPEINMGRSMNSSITVSLSKKKYPLIPLLYQFAFFHVSCWVSTLSFSGKGVSLKSL